MKRLSIILAIAALAVSCLDLEQKTELTFETNSTVNAYFKFIRVESGKLPLHTIMVADMNTEQMIIMLSLVGKNTGSIYDVIDNPNSDKAKAFTAAQQKYGDFNPTPSLFRYYTKRKGGGEWHLESGNCIYYAFNILTNIFNSSLTMFTHHTFNIYNIIIHNYFLHYIFTN